MRMISTHPIFASTSLPTCENRKLEEERQRTTFVEIRGKLINEKTYFGEPAIVPNFLQIWTLTRHHPLQVCNQNVHRIEDSNANQMRRVRNMMLSTFLLLGTFLLCRLVNCFTQSDEPVPLNSFDHLKTTVNI
jgi:hypothetical protein